MTLDAMDPATGKSHLNNLVLTSPAMSGLGESSDVSTMRTGRMICNGANTPLAAVLSGGARGS